MFIIRDKLWHVPIEQREICGRVRLGLSILSASSKPELGDGIINVRNLFGF